LRTTLETKQETIHTRDTPMKPSDHTLAQITPFVLKKSATHAEKDNFNRVDN